MVLVQEFMDDYLDGDLTDIQLIDEKIHDIVSQYVAVNGRPLLGLEEFVWGEPAESAKMNRMWTRLQSDINIVQDQLEVLRAAVVFVHNYVVTEVELARNQNAQASNKLKTLQLYSTAHDANIIQFGDYFANLDFVDLTLIPDDQKISLLNPGVISLGRDNQAVNLTDNLELRILDTSNGVPGNNQEILDPTTATTDPVEGKKLYVFKTQVEGRHGDLDHVTDAEPNTWLEYESYQVTKTDRVKAKDLNFVYRISDNANSNTTALDIAGPVLMPSTDTPGLFDWAKGPQGGILKLNLEFDMGEAKTINTISFVPFGLESNKNAPIKVALVQTSDNGTDWTAVSPQNVYIATDANLQAARSADNVSIGSALFTFDERTVRYVRVNIEQKESINCNIVHLYYETKKTVVYEKKTIPHPTIPGATVTQDIPITKGGDRVLGPIPPIHEPERYYGDNGLVAGDLVQNVEYFIGKRWAIGIRDILIEASEYKPTSIMISKPFRIPGVVDRVSIEADTFVPPNFPTDDGALWVKFFVTPNDGLDWYPISRIQDDFLGIPEIIAFNDPIPADFREIGVQYIKTNSVVNSLRVKVELSRPEDLISSSPIFKSYKLKVVKR